MLRQKIKYLLLLFHFNCVYSQNLVTNGSFEYVTDCITPAGAINLLFAPPWFSPTTGGSCDLFTECGLSVPNNWGGFQEAHDGGNYAGMSIYLGNFREYIGIRLNAPLVIGEKYCVTFFLNPTDSSKFVIDGAGALLTTDSISEITSGLINRFSQINNQGGIISDEVNWTKITDTIIADSAYTYLYIGNFLYDSLCTFETHNDGYNLSYYFVDNISVTKYEAPTQNTNILTVSNFYDTDQLLISFYNPDNLKRSILIIDDIGRIIHTVTTNENTVTFNYSTLSNGVYIISIVDDQNKIAHAKCCLIK